MSLIFQLSMQQKLLKSEIMNINCRLLLLNLKKDCVIMKRIMLNWHIFCLELEKQFFMQISNSANQKGRN